MRQKPAIDCLNCVYSYNYPRPAVTVDVAAFSRGAKTLQVLLIRRRNNPYQNHWALPGGFIEMDEDLEAAAHRELKEETGLTGLCLEQFQTFGKPGRDPRGRTVSVVYLATADADTVQLKPGSDASDAKWFDVQVLPELAFDHAEIIAAALVKLRSNKPA